MASRPNKSAKKAPTKKATKKSDAKKATKKATKTSNAKRATKKATKKSTAKRAAKKATKKSTAKRATKKATKKSNATRATKSNAKNATRRTAAKKPAAIVGGAEATAHAVTGEVMAGLRTEGLRAESVIAAAVDDVAPCRLVDHGEGRFSLCFDDFRMPRVPMFDERGLAGNGYTWEAIVDALVRKRRSDLVDQIGYDSESAMFVATGARATLLVVAELVRQVIADESLLKSTLDSADPDRLE
jgi:cell wall-associated NlpC family hydrolase